LAIGSASLVLREDHEAIVEAGEIVDRKDPRIPRELCQLVERCHWVRDREVLVSALARRGLGEELAQLGDRVADRLLTDATQRAGGLRLVEAAHALLVREERLIAW